jgi:aryl-alcohol dehydrogenase-like predicted oxidoreductase
MQYTRLGKSGLEVSRICLGCMSFGNPGERRPWTLPEDEARPIFRAAWDAGVNFIDTANSYSEGSSEEVTGKLIRELAPREEIVLASKVFNRMRPGPNGAGLNRKTIFTQLDATLKRLDTDYLDLYQIHRWDHKTPIEETLEALTDCVKAGKVRYIGASSMYAWQFAKALYTSDRYGYSRFISMQDQINLLYREEEREMLPLCRAEGVGVIPWGPLSSGKLTRAWGEATKRNTTDANGKTMYAAEDPVQKEIISTVGAIASERGVSYARVALAWVLQKPGVTAPIIGATKVEHLTEAVNAVEFALSADEVARLEKPYRPRPISANL